MCACVRTCVRACVTLTDIHKNIMQCTYQGNTHDHGMSYGSPVGN